MCEGILIGGSVILSLWKDGDFGIHQGNSPRMAFPFTTFWMPIESAAVR
jgi:hypothetical protein